VFLNENSEVTSFFSFTTSDVEELKGSLLIASIFAKTKIPSDVKFTISSDHTKGSEWLFVLEKPDKWKKLELSTYIDQNASQINIKLEVRHHAQPPVFFDKLELKSKSAFNSPINIEYLEKRNPNHLKIKFNAPSEGYLIRKENFHSNWSALLDGQDQKIMHYDKTFQALKVSKGIHTAQFSFNSYYPFLFWGHLVAVLIGYILFFKDVFYFTNNVSNID